MVNFLSFKAIGSVRGSNPLVTTTYNTEDYMKKKNKGKYNGLAKSHLLVVEEWLLKPLRDEK